MANLFRKSFFSPSGFLAGLIVLLTGYIIVVCTFPEEIWFLGLVILVIGLILTILSARYFIGIADKENSELIKKLNKKG